MSKYQQCECNFCGGTLRYEISKANELVNCQDCGMETVIFVPGGETPYPENEYFLQATNIGWSKHSLGFRNVIGTVVNNSQKDLDWVRIEFTLVNRESLPIGSTSDCLLEFPVNGVWRFHAPVFQSEAVGVGAPLISCEYGKISQLKRIVHPAAVAAAAPANLIVPPLSAPQHAPPQRLQPEPQSQPELERPRPSAQVSGPKPAKRSVQWSSICITGGVTGVAHHQ
jgi:hypothetical protein